MDRISKILADIQQKGWSFSPEFLDKVGLREINEFFNQNYSSFRGALIGQGGDKKRIEGIRGDFTYWLDPLNPPVVFLSILKFLEELKMKLNEKYYLGLKEYECHLAYYPIGTFYKKHYDRFEADSSRTFTFVFYLNEEWLTEDGGELLLYDHDGNLLETLSPSPGALACFVTSDFPHEVKVSKRERRSLTGWMHTKIIY